MVAPLLPPTTRPTDPIVSLPRVEGRVRRLDRVEWVRVEGLISTGAPVTVSRLVATGNRSDSFMPRWPRMLVGTVSSWAPVSAHDRCNLILLVLRDEIGTGHCRSM